MLIPLLIALAAQQVTPLVPDYVPDTGWRDNESDRAFYERWFGNQLRAMHEPPLSSEADLGGFRERFRLLVLPSFEPAYAYRIDVRPDGAASLRWARLNGRGGYAPGVLAREGSRQLRGAEVRRWRSALALARLDAVAREEPVEGWVKNRDGTESVTVCLDGTTYVFEHLSAQGRRFVVRSCGIDAPLWRLAAQVSRLHPREAMN